MGKELTLDPESSQKELTILLSEISRNDYYLSRDERHELVYFSYIANLKMKQEELAVYMDVGKTTVKQSLSVVRNMLRGYNLQLLDTPKQGLSVAGDEENIRRALLEFLYDCCALSVPGQDNATNFFVPKEVNPHLREMIHQLCAFKESLSSTFKIFSQMVRLVEPIPNDEIYKMSFILLFVALYRVQNGFQMGKSSSVVLTASGKEVIAFLCNESSKLANDTLTEADFLPLVVCLGSSYVESAGEASQERLLGSVILIQRMLNLLVQNISGGEDFSFDMDNDGVSNAVTMLYNHMHALVERQHSGISIKNAFLDEIMEDCHETFLFVRQAVSEFNEKYGPVFDLTDDELGYLVLLVENLNGAILASSELNKKVVLVCGMGHGTSQILKNRLENRFKVRVLRVVSSYQLEPSIYEDADLLISTMPIMGISSKRVVTVTPLLNAKDMELLRRAGVVELSAGIAELLAIIEANATITNKKRLLKQLHELLGIPEDEGKYASLFKVIGVDHIALEQSVDSWQEAVALCGDLLVAAGCAEKSYAIEMVENIERLGAYITIGKGVALPHALNHGNVLKTGFSLVTLSQPVCFSNGTEVSLLLGFCNAGGKEYIDPLIAFMDLIEHHELLEAQRGWSSPYDFFEYIKRIAN